MKRETLHIKILIIRHFLEFCVKIYMRSADSAAREIFVVRSSSQSCPDRSVPCLSVRLLKNLSLVAFKISPINGKSSDQKCQPQDIQSFNRQIFLFKRP